MKLALFFIGVLTFASDVKDIRIHELEMQIAERDYAIAQEALQRALKAHATSKTALEASKLDACKAAGGKTVDDCAFKPDAVTLKKKEEPKK